MIRVRDGVLKCTLLFVEKILRSHSWNESLLRIFYTVIWSHAKVSGYRLEFKIQTFSGKPYYRFNKLVYYTSFDVCSSSSSVLALWAYKMWSFHLDPSRWFLSDREREGGGLKFGLPSNEECDQMWFYLGFVWWIPWRLDIKNTSHTSPSARKNASYKTIYRSSDVERYS